MYSSISVAISSIVPRIMEIGLQRQPKEACGIVVPDLERPVDDWVIELVNRSTSPEQHYEIDPSTIASLVKDADEEAFWDNVLIWHTHPSGHVGPSKMDLDSRHPKLRYLVVSLPRGEAVMF